MEDQKWLRLVTVGLVLAAVAVGYFLFVGRFSSNKAVPGTVPSATASASPSVAPSIKPVSATKPTPTPSPSPTSAYNKIAERNAKGGQPTDTLPRTGFPVVSTVILLSSLVISGWGLRRFPH